MESDEIIAALREALLGEPGAKRRPIRAVFMALKEYVRENADKGNITYLDGVASIRNFCRGAFATSTGPWVRGVNGLVVAAVELDPFKGVLAGVIPTNNTDGANPVIAWISHSSQMAENYGGDTNAPTNAIKQVVPVTTVIGK